MGGRADRKLLRFASASVVALSIVAAANLSAVSSSGASSAGPNQTGPLGVLPAASSMSQAGAAGQHAAVMRPQAPQIFPCVLAAAQCSPPTYHTGPIMGATPATPGTVDIQPVYWDPTPAAFSLPTQYVSNIQQFLDAVATASSAQTDIFSVMSQYYDVAYQGGPRYYLQNHISVEPPLTLNTPFPAPGCAASGVDTACLTDQQLRTELTHVAHQKGLSSGLGHLYLFMLPSGVETCYGTAMCSNGSNFQPSYCGYHASFATTTMGQEFIYADIPFPVSCADLNTAVGTNLASDAIDVIAHETTEAITDPTGVGWHNTDRQEIADLCSYEFGSTYGASGQSWNQLISGHEYLLQLIYSDAAHGCVGGMQTLPVEASMSPGYWEVSNTGAVVAFGGAPALGSMSGHPLNEPVVGMAPMPTGKGYRLAAADGGIFAFGDASFYGSMGGHPLNKPIVGMAATPDGQGYWLVASDGGIFSFGDAGFYGSMGGHPLNKPIVGMAPTSTGGGYWEVASDGGIFAFGNAAFYGSMGGKPLNRPIVGIVPTATNQGYRLVASDGGIFAFGDAGFYGSVGGQSLGQPIVGAASSPDGKGYWEMTSNGTVFAFGDASPLSALGGQTYQLQMVGIVGSH